MKGMKAKETSNPIKKLTYDEWNQEYFETLPDFIKDKMKATQEYKDKFDKNLSEDDKQYIAKMREDHNAKIDEEDINVSDIPF
jgi:hypothetical protein